MCNKFIPVFVSISETCVASSLQSVTSMGFTKTRSILSSNSLSFLPAPSTKVPFAGTIENPLVTIQAPTGTIIQVTATPETPSEDCFFSQLCNVHCSYI